MRGILDIVVYVLTAPIRLFGRSRPFRLALGAVLLVGLAFFGTLWALDSFFPLYKMPVQLAKLPPPPPLPPIVRHSVVITPVAVSLSAIGRALDKAAPRDFSGKNDNPVTKLLGQAEIGLTVTRGAMSVSGANNTLTVTTPLTGVIHVTGQVGTQAGRAVGGIGSAIGSLFGDSVGKQIKTIATSALDQQSQFRGDVITTTRPALTSAWRLQPNLSARLNFSNSSMNIAGIRINAANEIRPLLEPAINSQIGNLETRLRNDPFIEKAARAQWTKMCRSIPLGGGKTGLPKLWLEMKPVRAAAAQPRIDARNVTLTVGVQAETRVTAKETKPNCPFPAKLELVPPMQNGKLTVGLPIDVPFADVNKLLEAQLKGRHFPEDHSGPVDVEVRGVHVAAAGDRLLISLKVKATEKKSWFGLGANATVHIWGKPALDPKDQILRLTDISLAIESDAFFGLLGAASRAALPYLQQALAEQAVVDLKPLAKEAKKKIAAALNDFKTPSPGTIVNATVNDLRLTSIAFDAHTLRIIAEAAGSVNVAVTELPKF
jgi:hypothetical protein